MIAGAAAAVIAIAAGPIRLHSARKEADAFAAEKGLTVQYTVSDDISSKEAFMAELCKIAVWEGETRAAIDEAFGFADKDYTGTVIRSVHGYESADKLQAGVMKEKWQELRRDLEWGVEDAADAVFEKAGDDYVITKSAFLTCYREKRFEKIIEVAQLVESGSGKEAYDYASSGLKEDWRAVPMDVAYGLDPKLLTSGCEAALKSAVKTNDLDEVSTAVDRAQRFADRYQVKPDNLYSAQKKEEVLEYENKPEVPEIGMKTWDARDTKLGPPSETTRRKQSFAHQTHESGDMYWYKDGRQIFKAHYMDYEITNVSDTRNVKPPSSRSLSYSGGSSDSTFDPEDHDIEGYYEDYRDEYDDYDDAYDGFLDDEDAWDDY